MRAHTLILKRTLPLAIVCVFLFSGATNSGFCQTGNVVENKTALVANPLRQSIPNPFSWFGRWIKRIIGIKPKPIVEYHANVVDLKLDLTEITERCGSTSVSNDPQKINVSPVVVNPAADVLGYRYYVSGGKIVDANPDREKEGFFWFPDGIGQNAVWDLSSVQAGTYSITAGVDDGCGICGKTATKSVKVLPCPQKHKMSSPLVIAVRGELKRRQIGQSRGLFYRPHSFRDPFSQVFAALDELHYFPDRLVVAK